MMHDPTDSTPGLLSYEASAAATLTLEANQVEQAIALSRPIPNLAQQWQTYVSALGLMGFEQWLSERAADLAVNHQTCSLWQPAYANVLGAVCNLRVGEFRVCLITWDSLSSDVTVPRAAIDLPEFLAHLYVVLEVEEELSQVRIVGCLRHDQLRDRQLLQSLRPDADWTYALPLNWFDPEPDQLLLYLRCLEPTAIPLPDLSPLCPAKVSQIQAELTKVSHLLQDPERSPWQILSWEQGATVLSHPPLVNWVYQLQVNHSQSQTHGLSTLAQQAVKTGLWLQDQMDNFAQSLSWQLLPSLAIAPSALRSSEEFEAILADLQHGGLTISAQARAAYRDFILSSLRLRLYAVVWPQFSPDHQPEWTLLLILGPQPEAVIDQAVTLRVSDQTQALVERTLYPGLEHAYLYASVAGTWQETFWVTIDLMNGEMLTLAPFAFDGELGS